jgi:hypothetical protein
VYRVGQERRAAGGALSDLRTMSTALMGRLDVEPLDSLFGIEGAHLPANSGSRRLEPTVVEHEAFTLRVEGA